MLPETTIRAKPRATNPHKYMDLRLDLITIEAARRGDRGAQAELLRALQDPWFRLCMALLGDETEARDAVQESALRLLRQLGEFRSQSQLQTWALGIAVNVVRET